MEIRTLRYFLAVAREENMTKAAEILHVTQPTLSKTLRALEDELGKKLFTRHSFSISLTEEGTLLRKRAEDLVSMADKIIGEFVSLDDITGGELYFGLAESYQIRYLAQEIKRFIMFGGSDGIYDLTKLAAEQYVKRGMTVLALAYWNEPGLPDGFEKVPVEFVEKAALWLREHGYTKVGLWGISMGAEFALLAGSLMPELISCVTAVCPTNICGQGFIKKKSIQALECSAFSWRRKDLPWARLKLSKTAILRDSLRERSVCLRSCYEDAVRNAPEEAQIKVENIGGPVLLIYPEYDAMWPSELSAEKIKTRLKEKHFAYPCKCVSYKYASHMLVPLKSRSTVMFRVERKYPEQCWESDLDAFEKTLAFWKEVW